MRDVWADLYRQLALDYCVSFEEASDRKNHFSTFTPLPGRRRFRSSDDCALKVVAVNGKLLFTGKEEIVASCREKYAETTGDWFMDIRFFRQLDELVKPYGYRMISAHPFYLPGSDAGTKALIEAEDAAVADHDYETVVYDEKEIEQFRGDDRFQEAYSFEAYAPDMIGVGAIRDGEIIGMAGASADSDLLWQMGIDVAPEARGKHVGAHLVRILKEEILKSGHTPFYGTSMSNIGSQRVAHHAGFVAAWAELSSIRAFDFYGWETAVARAVTKEYPFITTPRDLYEALTKVWSRETCAPRMRQDWSMENQTLGQCSVTAFLAQDIFGGKVYGVPLEDGGVHCYNVVGDCVFDLTSAQFGERKLNYENNPEQKREEHFAKAEKKERYEMLKAALKKLEP